MIHAGQTVENPITGERLTFHATSADTNGEYVLVETAVKPNGFVAAPHMHPYQTERFQILSGTLKFKLGRKTVEAKAGDVVTVEAGVGHKFWNDGHEDARFLTEIRPALQFEQLIETMFGLAADGKTNRKGMPNPLRLAVVAKHHFDEVRLPFPPVWMQRMGLAMGAPVGRMLGYAATYTRIPRVAVVSADDVIVAEA